jgi:NAD(P)H-quinone oxidoreductase subunit 5
MDALSGLAIAAALTPGLLGFALPRLARFPAATARRAAAAAAILSLGLTVATCAVYAWNGPATGSLLWLEAMDGFRVSLGARVDGLTVLMLATVTVIVVAVARYAVRYLDGDPGQARFVQWISYTSSAVLVVIVSSNLAMFFAGWVATSHGLHRLLTHWSDRRAALLAARKKFLISRLGDVLLVLAFVLLARRFGTLEFEEIFARAAALPADDGSLLPIATLVVLGAMTKSAQFPFHTWLPDSMETPTPVSALMHAGIINAGGFLLIRMSPLLACAPAALAPLAAGGAFTALLGSAVMLTQTDAKRKYAYSTVAQMGFMMLQCGLGAFAPAALHMVGHAFYKGYAFLSAGSVVDPEPSAPPAPVASRAGLFGTALALGAGVLVVVGVAAALGVDPAGKPGLAVLGGILAIAVAQMIVAADPGPRRDPHTFAATVGIVTAIAAIYFAAVAAVGGLLGGAVPGPARVGSPGGVWITAGVLSLFGAAFVLQHRVVLEGASPLARAAYVHAYNGFYLGALEDRLVERLWPLPRRDGAVEGA